MSAKEPQLFEYANGRIRWVSGPIPPDPLEALRKLQAEEARLGEKGWTPNPGYAHTPQSNNQLWSWDDEKKGSA